MNCKTAFAAIEARLRHLEAENRILQEELGIQECLVKQLCVKFATSPKQLKY